MESKILVVDDEEIFRLTTSLRLKEAGFSVDTASEGYEGLVKLDQGTYDVVLLDINMPGLNGLQVLEYVSANHPDVDAIVLTGFSQMTMAIECLKKGAKEFIVKPFDYADLIAKIQGLLRTRNSERSFKEYQQSWRSTLVYDIFGSLYTVSCILEHLRINAPIGHPNDTQELLSYARTLNERVFERIQHSVNLPELAETHVPMELSAVDLRAILNTICERFDQWAGDKSVTIKRDFASNIPTVMTDLARIEQVFSLIFDSALKHTTGKETIEVRLHAVPKTEQRTAGVECSLSFPGKLLEPQLGSLIFSPSLDQWKEHKESVDFVALSLAISRRILEANDGALSLQVQGSSTTIACWLPEKAPAQSGVLRSPSRAVGA
ncbi:MAG: response regulator [Ignavibacteriales bacterium]|nr:response regulator [Ignavibacteriales bacterium]